MTDVGGLGLVTSSTTTAHHTSHTHSSRHQSQNQNQQQHSLRSTSTNNTRGRSSTSSPLSTSHHSSTSTTLSTTNIATATTKGRVTRAAAAAAAVAAKAAEETDREKTTGKMSSTITAAAVSTSSSSSHRSSNSTTPPSPISHHQHPHQQPRGGHSSSNYLQPPPPPHSHHTERYPHTRSSQHQSNPTSTYTDSSLAFQHPSSSSSDASHQQAQTQDRLRGPLTRKRAASLVAGELGDRTKRLGIDLDAARSGTKVSTSGAKQAAGAGGCGGTSPEDTRPGTREDLDTHSVSSLGGGSVGSVGGVGSGHTGSHTGGGHSAGGHSGGGSTGGGNQGLPQRDLICLCTPAPKVPRPRNAFILYRQHHQARVVAENPGLANPEISKIIGEKWRAESDQHKEEWKQLAEEEKLHHQRKYPEYKYQPRRGNKNSASVAGELRSARTSPTTPGAGPGIGGLGSAGGIGGQGVGEHPGRCPNCGGRYIATPRTPSTPFGAAGSGSGSSKSAMHASEGRGGGQSAFCVGMDTPRGMEHHASSSRSQQHFGQQQHGGYRDHRASVSSQGGYQAYPSRDYHHSQTYHYPTPSHQQSYPAHPLYDMPQEYDVSTPTGTSSKRRRYDSTSMPYRPEREYALPSPTTPYGHGSSSRHPSISGQYTVRPPSHYHQQQSPMSPTPLGYGHSHGHGHGQPMHHYPPPPPPTPSAALGGGGGTGGGSVPPTPGFAPPPSGPPTSTAALSGPASLAPSGRGRSPLANTMAPPPRPPTLSIPGSSGHYHHNQQHPPSGSRSGLSPVRMRGDDSVFDPSLRLPPLQTHLAHLPPNSPESRPSSGSGAGAGLLSAGGDRSIGLGITYPAHGDHHRDPRSASSGGSHPYPRLTGTGTAGNTPTAGSFPASYQHQGAHPHQLAQAPTSVHPSWATSHHGQREQQVPRSDPSLATATKDNKTATLSHHPSQALDPTGNTANSKKQLALLEAQQRQQSVEAMVMSIDYVRKASVLRRIGRELPAYGAVADHLDNLSEAGDDAAHEHEHEQSQVMTTRGPIIAVEGPNKELLRVVGKAVEKALVELGDCEVRSWVGEGDVWDSVAEGGSSGEGEKGDGKREGGKGGEDVAMGDTIMARGSSSPKSNNRSSSPSLVSTTTANKNPFPRYLDLMLSWHHKASELTKFVTTPYFPSTSSPSPSSSPLPSSHHPSRQASRHPSRNSSRHPSHSPSMSAPGQGQQKLPKLPIALLPLGYSLTYSDRFACSIPIADAYAPVDHWQWMATLWRGIVGPDLTVYVQPVTEEQMMLEGRMQARVEVEVKGERLIAVRVVVPPSPSGHTGSGHAHGGQMDAAQKEAVVEELGEEAENKLAYEVGEWVRAGQFGVQGRGGVARGERGQVQVGYETGSGREGGGYGGEGW